MRHVSCRLRTLSERELERKILGVTVFGKFRREVTVEIDQSVWTKKKRTKFESMLHLLDS